MQNMAELVLSQVPQQCFIRHFGNLVSPNPHRSPVVVGPPPNGEAARLGFRVPHIGEVGSAIEPITGVDHLGMLSDENPVTAAIPSGFAALNEQ